MSTKTDNARIPTGFYRSQFQHSRKCGGPIAGTKPRCGAIMTDYQCNSCAVATAFCPECQVRPACDHCGSLSADPPLPSRPPANRPTYSVLYCSDCNLPESQCRCAR